MSVQVVARRRFHSDFPRDERTLQDAWEAVSALRGKDVTPAPDLAALQAVAEAAGEPDDHKRYRYLNFAGMRVRVDSYRMAVVQDGEWEHFFEWKHSGVRRADDLAEAIWEAMSRAAEGAAEAPDSATVEACARAAYEASLTAPRIGAHGQAIMDPEWSALGETHRGYWREVARAVLAAAGRGGK